MYTFSKFRFLNKFMSNFNFGRKKYFRITRFYFFLSNNDNKNVFKFHSFTKINVVFGENTKISCIIRQKKKGICSIYSPSHKAPPPQEETLESVDFEKTERPYNWFFLF